MPRSRFIPPRCQRFALSLLLPLTLACGTSQAAPTTPAQQLQRFAADSGAAGDAARGQRFFNQRHQGSASCAGCHGAPPTGNGKHSATGKVLEPLAPAANPRSFTDSARVDKWLRRNCADVLARECSAQEKADVLAYLIGLPR